MKRYLVPLLVLCLTTVVYATPPKDLQVAYGNGVLDVKMKHITTKPRKHYIRTIEVTVNGAEPQIFHYPFQQDPAEFEVSIPMVLKPRDQVVVKAECSQGGSAQTQMTVYAPESSSKEAAEPVKASPQDTSVTTPYGK